MRKLLALRIDDPRFTEWFLQEHHEHGDYIHDLPHITVAGPFDGEVPSKVVDYIRTNPPDIGIPWTLVELTSKVLEPPRVINPPLHGM